LQNPGNALAIRFRRLGDLGDINESVLMFEEAISLYPPGHPAKAICLSNFGFCLQSRFERLCGLGNLDHSMSVSSEASIAGQEKCYTLAILSIFRNFP
jgi:hypothetical protein